MIKLADILNEGKQVGILYHYTENWLLQQIIESNTLLSPVSFTRSKDKTTVFWIGEEFALVIEGNKLSNNFKIRPYQSRDEEDNYFDEMEERVDKNIVDFENYENNAWERKVKIIESFVDEYFDDLTKETERGLKVVSKDLIEAKFYSKFGTNRFLKDEVSLFTAMIKEITEKRIGGKLVPNEPFEETINPLPEKTARTKFEKKLVKDIILEEEELKKKMTFEEKFKEQNE
jgi:hypothetical protein